MIGKLVIVSFALLAASLSTATAGKPMTNAGKLICNIEPLPAGQQKSVRDVSCRFEALAGRATVYKGSVKPISGSPLVDANLVFMWTVLATKAKIPPGALNGVYLSSMSKSPGLSAVKVGSLHRKAKIPIELRALTPGPSKAGKLPVVVLELELRSTRT